MTRYKCIKTLYKSTYKRSAFIRGRYYSTSETATSDPGFVVLIDEFDQAFAFNNDTFPPALPYYRLANYFEVVPVVPDALAEKKILAFIKAHK